MITRIRLDATGMTPDEVTAILYPHADEIERMLGVPVSRGEFVISRQLEVPEGSPYAFEGRLILHPDVSVAIADGDGGFTVLATTGSYAGTVVPSTGPAGR